MVKNFRLIKFRAWDVKRKYYGAVIDIDFVNENVTIIPDENRVDLEFVDNWPVLEFKNIILEQFTGLYDKTGREIYDGDIVETAENVFATIIYHDIWNGFCIKFIVKRGQCINGDGIYIIEKDRYIFKILGNIHENLELLGRD